MAAVLCGWDNRDGCFLLLSPYFRFPEDLAIRELCVVTIESNFRWREEFCIIELASGTIEI